MIIKQRFFDIATKMYKNINQTKKERWDAKAEKDYVCKYIHQVHPELMVDWLVLSVIYT